MTRKNLSIRRRLGITLLVVCGALALIVIALELSLASNDPAPTPTEAPIAVAPAQTFEPPLARRVYDREEDSAWVLACLTVSDYKSFAPRYSISEGRLLAKREGCVDLNDRHTMRLKHYHEYRIVDRRDDGYVCVRSIVKIACYWTAAANLHHIGTSKLTDDQYERAVALHEQLTEAEEQESDYRSRALKAVTMREQQRLTTLAEQAGARAEELYERIKAIKPPDQPR